MYLFIWMLVFLFPTNDISCLLPKKMYLLDSFIVYMVGCICFTIACSKYFSYYHIQVFITFAQFNIIYTCVWVYLLRVTTFWSFMQELLRYFLCFSLFLQPFPLYIFFLSFHYILLFVDSFILFRVTIFKCFSHYHS